MVLMFWRHSTPEDKVKWYVVPMTAYNHAQGSSSGRLSGVTAENVQKKLRASRAGEAKSYEPG